MTWKDNLFKASFRNVPFEVEAVSDESGRRNQVHEYPNKNIPYVEDMGKKAETFSIEGFIIGDDYTSRRNALRAALSAEGAGDLIHPSYGEISVVCDSFSISERYASEGRMVRFSMTFIESGAQEMPSAATDYKDRINTLANEVEQSSAENFVNRFNIDGESSVVTDAVAGTVSTWATQAAGAISYANSKLYAGTADIRVGIDAVDEITGVANDLDDLSKNALSLLNMPDVIAARVSACMGVLNNALPPRDAINQAKKASINTAAQTENINTNTPKGRSQAVLTEQFNSLTIRVSIANQAKSIANTEFTNTEDAEAMLNDFTAQVEKQMLSTVATDDEVMQSLQDLRAMVVKNVAETIKRLPEVRLISLNEPTPSVVLAYNLYDDITRASEIINRNKVTHPGFVPAGKDIEVLTK